MDVIRVRLFARKTKEWIFIIILRWSHPELVKPLLTPLLTISNRDFKEKYGIMSGSWRGKSHCKEMRF